MSSLTRTCLSASSSSSHGKTKQRRIIKIRLLRNGNTSFTGVIMRLEPQKYTSLSDILHDMTEFMRNSIFIPTAGIRQITTIDGRPIEHVEDLTDGETYVILCLSEKFKNVPYCLPNFYDRPGSASSDSSSKCKSVCSETCCTSHTSMRSNYETIQPRRITVIREGTSPRKVFRLLLNHRNAVSYEKLITTINDLLCLDAGPMQAIFTQSGNRVNCLEDFFGYHYIFFAFHKKNNFTFMDFQLNEDEIERINKLNKIPGSEKVILKVPTVRTCEDFDEISPQIRMKYTIGKTIGKGRYSVVKECYVKDWKDSGMKLAMKIIYKNNDNYKNLLNELSILKSVRHPNIIRLHYIHDAAYKLYLFTEFLGEGDLRSVLKSSKIPELEAKSFVKDIVSGLFYIHCLQIVHRDVKPSNLMITRDQYGKRILKLIDFRAACKSNKLLYEICGTTFFMSPEMLRNTGYDHGLDIWAAGVILYYMLVQVPPFLGNDEEEDRRLILEGELDFSSDDWVDVSGGAKDLIVNMLCSDPYERYSAEEVLVHPWITTNSLEIGDGDWEKEGEDESKVETECEGENRHADSKDEIDKSRKVENTDSNIHCNIQTETNNIENLKNITRENVDKYEESKTCIPLEASNDNKAFGCADEKSQKITNFSNNILEEGKIISTKVVFEIQDRVGDKEKADSGDSQDGDEHIGDVGDTKHVDVGVDDKVGSNTNTVDLEEDDRSTNEVSENDDSNHLEIKEINDVGVDTLKECNRKCGEGELIGNDYYYEEIDHCKSDGDHVLTKSESETGEQAEEMEIIEIYKNDEKDRECVEDNLSETSYCSEEILDDDEINMEEELEVENVEYEDSENGDYNDDETECRECVSNGSNENIVETDQYEAADEYENENDNPVEMIVMESTGENNIDDEHRRKCVDGKFLLERKYENVEILHCEALKNVVMKVSKRIIQEEQTGREGLKYYRKLEEQEILEKFRTNEIKFRNFKFDKHTEEVAEYENTSHQVTEEIEDQDLNYLEEDENYEAVVDSGETDEDMEHDESLEHIENVDLDQFDEYEREYEDVDFNEMEYEDENEGEYEDEEIEEESEGYASENEERSSNSDNDEIDALKIECEEVCDLERQYVEENEENLVHRDEYREENDVETFDMDDEDQNISRVKDLLDNRDSSDVDSEEANFAIGMEEYEIMVIEEESEEVSQGDQVYEGSLVDSDGGYIEEDDLVDGAVDGVNQFNEDELKESRNISGDFEEDELELDEYDGEVGDDEEDDEDNEWEDASEGL